jgi:NHL repeat
VKTVNKSLRLHRPSPQGQLSQKPARRLRASALIAALSTVTAVAVLVCTRSARAANTVADIVLGQPDFSHNGSNVGATGLDYPFGIAIDTTVTPNHLYVADKANNRVLGWKDASSLSNGAAADLVIGQPNFSSSSPQNGGVNAHSLNNPEELAIDSHGNLYVGDTYDSRVLVYYTPYRKTNVTGSGDTVADMVFGQPNFNSHGCNGLDGPNQPPPTANTMCQPVGVALDKANNLYVGEAGNNRVLEFNNPIGTKNTTPDMVFGQPNFNSDNDYQCNRLSRPYGTPSATDFCAPENVAVDGAGNLYVGDHWYNRALEFDMPVNTGYTTPETVLGQRFFSTDYAGSGPTGLFQPRAPLLDSAGHLYLSDQGNSRVLVYKAPPTTDESADLVFGQYGSFNTSQCNVGGSPSASTLCHPGGMALDPAGNLYVADVWNNRVLIYDQPLN